MVGEPTIGLAILAGLVSFISPCVLPLVPAYVGYIGGHATAAAGDEQRGKFATLLNGLAFVLGFTAFFVGFGLLTTAFSSFLNTIGIDIPGILTRLGGVAVIFFGLYIMKALDPVFNRGLKMAEYMKDDRFFGWFFTIIFLAIFGGYLIWALEVTPENPVTIGLFIGLFLLLAYFFRTPMNTADSIGDFWSKAIMQLQVALISDTRNLEMGDKQEKGYIGSFGMGTVFAAGWTPCIGPIYGSILALAADASADGASLLTAGSLLFAYSMGLGVPFLITAFALNQASGVMRGLKRNMRKVEYVSGILLIFIGFLILSGNLEELSRVGGEGELGEFSVRVEACAAGVAEGHIMLGTLGNCITDGTDKLTNISSPLSSRQGEITSSIFTAQADFDYSALEVGLEEGNLAPNFTITTLNGESYDLESLRGDTVILLNFWATWCGPCQIEMPAFQNIYDEYKDRGFNVIAVDFLEPPEQIQPFVDELGLEFVIGLDESGEINDLFEVTAYPTSVLIDGHGVVIERHSGPLIEAQLLELLDSFDSDA